MMPAKRRKQRNSNQCFLNFNGNRALIFVSGCSAFSTNAPTPLLLKQYYSFHALIYRRVNITESLIGLVQPFVENRF
jgi:hypothetical protein